MDQVLTNCQWGEFRCGQPWSPGKNRDCRVNRVWLDHGIPQCRHLPIPKYVRIPSTYQITKQDPSCWKGILQNRRNTQTYLSPTYILYPIPKVHKQANVSSYVIAMDAIMTHSTSCIVPCTTYTSHVLQSPYSPLDLYLFK